MGLKSAHDWLSLKSMKSIINITTVTWLLLLLSDYTKAFVCVDHNKLWEILQEIGIPDHLTCLLRNLCCCCCCCVASVVLDSVWPHRWQPTRPPSLGFSRQEHWSGLPFPSPMHESEISMQIKKQQSELNMEQQTGSKLGKEYVKAVYSTLLI